MLALGRSQYPALQASCQENESSPLFVPGYAHGAHTECDLMKWGGGGGNVSLPVHLNPGFRSILVDSGLFTLFGLQNIRKG